MIVGGLVVDGVGSLCGAPGYFVEVVVFGQGEQGVEFGVVVMEDKGVGVGEELELFDGFLGLVLEELGMGHADVGEDAEGGMDDVGEVLHLVGFGDAGLEDGEVVMVGHVPYGEGHADLGVVAVGAFDDGEVVVQQGGEPFFHDGFAIGAGDADDGVVEKRTVVLGEGVQGGKGTLHQKEVAAGIFCYAVGAGDHEVADAFLLELGDVPVPVVLCGFEGKEEGLLGLVHFAAVVAQAGDNGISVVDA